MWIKLTKHNGELLVINTDYLISMRHDSRSNFTIITHYPGYHTVDIEVKEPIEEIYELINAN